MVFIKRVVQRSLDAVTAYNPHFGIIQLAACFRVTGENRLSTSCKLFRPACMVYEVLQLMLKSLVINDGPDFRGAH